VEYLAQYSRDIRDDVCRVGWIVHDFAKDVYQNTKRN
jgi:hypothetical protein